MLLVQYNNHFLGFHGRKLCQRGTDAETLRILGEDFSRHLSTDFLIVHLSFGKNAVDGFYCIVHITLHYSQHLRILRQFSLPVGNQLFTFLGQDGRKSLTCHQHACCQFLNKLFMLGIVFRKKTVSARTVKTVF